MSSASYIKAKSQSIDPIEPAASPEEDEGGDDGLNVEGEACLDGELQQTAVDSALNGLAVAASTFQQQRPQLQVSILCEFRSGSI